jgi:hypothetical protein
LSVRLQFTCPDREEDGWTFVEAETPAGLPAEAACGECGGQHALHRDRLAETGGLLGCLACGHPELFTQKNFPRGLGMVIVVVAAVLAPFTFYISLGVAAAIDLLLYWYAPDMLVCYVCSSHHHRFPRDPIHPHFDREIAERLKFGEQAVMGKPMRAGGTAGAPEPEH